MNTALKALWLKYTADCRGRESEWTEIEAAYSAPGRLYHTLAHLSGVSDGLSAYYGENIPAASVFALFYHDYIYSPLRGDNEKQSADYAFAKLSSWQVPSPIAAKARSIILATADHQSSDEETVVFLDADMAVLGSAENTYKEYITLVRKEFSIYPDLLYNRGRRKFIEGTLNRKEIFLTPTFREKYEDQARINLSSELKSLS